MSIDKVDGNNLYLQKNNVWEIILIVRAESENTEVIASLANVCLRSYYKWFVDSKIST